MSTSLNVNPADAMSQIAWLDTVERLDTLLLEIRHFQCNVIFSLRLPILYQALRFEERYLWGNDWPHGYKNGVPIEQMRNWFDIFRDMSSPTLNLRELADNWIIPFPILPEENIEVPGEDIKSETIHQKIAKNILEIVQCTISSGRWNRDALRHYHNLSILQILKSNVLHDKLVICHAGYHTFRSYIENPSKDHHIDDSVIAKFMIIRSAVTMRLNDYVGRFGDLQAQFDTSLDLSLQEDPAPMINRRHEQGFYTSFMSVRCQEIQDAINSLLSKFNLRGTDSTLDKPPQIMHRWRHDFTSTTQHLYDDVGQQNKSGARKRRQQINTQFINSSFWMPDRPDLLSSLAHELAHYNVYETYSDAWSPSLDTKDDKFTRLLKLLNHCLDYFQITNRNPKITPIDYPESSLIEISCDLIAASVEGHAFLYALFLELTACGELAYLLEAPKKRFDLDIHPNQYIAIDTDTIGRSWYYRLKLLCCWMKEIYHHPEDDNLIKIMVNGIDKIADNILDYISSITPTTGKDSQRFWEIFTKRLCKIASRSDASRLVREWRRSRSEHWHKSSKLATKGLLHLAPHYSRPLNVHIQNFLFRILLNVKQKPGRLLYEDMQQQQQKMESVIKAFCQKYFDIKDEEFKQFSKNFLCSSGNLILGDSSLLFRHIYDIPWRCAILSAIDFIHKESKASTTNGLNWLDLFHHKSALGRELYSVALEFYLHQTTAASDRLSISARVVKSLLDNNKVSQDSTLYNRLYTWLHGRNNNGDNIKLNKSINDLQEEIENNIDNIRNYFDPYQDSIIKKKADEEYLLNRHLEDTNTMIKKHGALAWRSMIKSLIPLKTTKNNETRLRKSIRLSVIEKCVGYKINELMEIINANIGEENTTPLTGDVYTILDELKLYLELWRSKNGSNKINREKTILSLLLSLEMEKLHIETQQNELASFLSNPNYREIGSCQLRCTEIGRLTAANHVTPNIGHSNTGALDSLFELWHGSGEGIHTSKAKNEENHSCYFVVLGRCDIISFNYTRPMSRTDLPHFNMSGTPSNIETEKFMPFFIRREIAIPYRLKHGEDQSDKGLLTPKDEDSKKILGFLSVLLTGRSSRLSFIARLIYLINNQTEQQEKTQQGLAKAAQLLKNGCYLFLCEGWGDILIVFKGETTLDRLDDIFSIQNIIYHDFLVSRTELVLTYHWLNTDFTQNFEDLKKKYKITSYFRICSDQELRNANENFINGMKKSLSDLKVSDLTLLKTPGRSDFAIDITPLFKEHTYEKFRIELNNNKNIRSEIDDILTIISQII